MSNSKPHTCKTRVKCSDCISPARARLCVHGTQKAQDPAQDRERNADDKANQRPFADRFGAHRRRLLEAQEQDQADQRDKNARMFKPVDGLSSCWLTGVCTAQPQFGHTTASSTSSLPH